MNKYSKILYHTSNYAPDPRIMDWLESRINTDPKLISLQLAIADYPDQCPECIRLNRLCQQCDAKFAAWSKHAVQKS